MRAVLEDGVLWVPRRIEGPDGLIGDAVERVERGDPDYMEWWNEAQEAITAAGWDESAHPRHDAGVAEGGQFAPKDGGSETGEPPVAEGATLEEQLANMGAYELEQGQDRHPERFMKHPKSGFMVEKPGVVYTEETSPVLDADGWGRKPPMLRDVVEGEGFGLPPGYTEADVESGEITSLGYGKYQIGVPHPPKFLYRAVSEGEYQQALERGFLQTDGRMNLTDTEGTVVALSDPSYYLPGKLNSDKPGVYEGRVLRIKYDPADGWRHDRDGYVKTSKPVPIDRVDMVTSKLRREVKDTGKGYTDFGPMEVTAALWDESKHPRDPKGMHTGGKFRTAEQIAEVSTPVLGLGSLEERAKAEAAWGNNEGSAGEQAAVRAEMLGWLQNQDVQMRVPEGAMLEAFRDGEFLNQHQHQEGARGMQRGVEGEARMLGVEPTAESLPKYGYLGPDNSQTNMYGPIKVTFNDQVKDRTTFTVDDSLMQGYGPVVPSAVRDPSYLSMSPLTWGSFQETGDGGFYQLIQEESVPYVEAQVYGKLAPEDIAHVEILDDQYWDEADPNTGVPMVSSREDMEAVISELDKRGIRWSTYQPEGDFSGEWA